jgi:hypothetical protein
MKGINKMFFVIWTMMAIQSHAQNNLASKFAAEINEASLNKTA